MLLAQASVPRIAISRTRLAARLAPVRAVKRPQSDKNVASSTHSAKQHAGMATAAAPAGVQPHPVTGTSANCWRQDAVQLTRPPLRQDTEADVVVVGAGLSGLTTALMCAKLGMSVVVLESRAVGAGMSGRSSGAVTQWDAGCGGFARIEARHGFAAAQQVADSRRAAFDWITSAISEEGIDCGWHTMSAVLAGGPNKESVEKELDACRRAGLGGAPSGAHPDGMLTARAGALDPVRYAQGLAAAIEKRGGRIFEGTRVKSGPFTISGKVVTLATNSTDGPVVHASRAIVLATHSPINRSLAVHTRQSPWRTYNMTFELNESASAPSDDTLLYTLGGHHARVVKEGGRRLLLVGGGDSDHVVGQMRERYTQKEPYSALEAWARSNFPAAGRAVQRWSAVVFRPADLLGLYGVNPLDVGHPKTRVITGNGGDAVMGAAVAGLAVTNDITGAQALEWGSLYDPSRVQGLATSLSSLGDLATEIGLNVRGYANVLLPTCWRDVKGLVMPGAVERSIAPGDGAVVQEGLRKVALYRDEQGTLHRRSALCPHMHVLLQWNPLEKTFDCTGHGSVFCGTGECISGPSARDLEDLGWRREAEGRGEGGGNITK